MWCKQEDIILTTTSVYKKYPIFKQINYLLSSLYVIPMLSAYIRNQVGGSCNFGASPSQYRLNREGFRISHSNLKQGGIAISGSNPKHGLVADIPYYINHSLGLPFDRSTHQVTNRGKQSNVFANQEMLRAENY